MKEILEEAKNVSSYFYIFYYEFIRRKRKENSYIAKNISCLFAVFLILWLLFFISSSASSSFCRVTLHHRRYITANLRIIWITYDFRFFYEHLLVLSLSRYFFWPGFCVFFNEINCRRFIIHAHFERFSPSDEGQRSVLR